MTASIRYRDASAYKYQLLDDWIVQTGIVGQAAQIHEWIDLSQEGVLRIHAGYAWDGASGPTIDVLRLPGCRPQSAMRASLAHDALYQLEREGRLAPGARAACDEVLYRLCLEDGFWPWRARLWLWALRRFAAFAARRQVETVYTAP